MIKLKKEDKEGAKEVKHSCKEAEAKRKAESSELILIILSVSNVVRYAALPYRLKTKL